MYIIFQILFLTSIDENFENISNDVKLLLEKTFHNYYSAICPTATSVAWDYLMANLKGIVKLGVQELVSLGSLSSSTKDKLSRSPLDPWSLKL